MILWKNIIIYNVSWLSQVICDHYDTDSDVFFPVLIQCLYSCYK